MPDQNLVDNIRKENYNLLIYAALNNNQNVIELTTDLIQFVQEVYRSLEPGHFDGHLVIFSSLDDSPLLDVTKATKFIDKNILISNNSDNIVIQFFQDEGLPLIWQNIDFTEVIESDNAVVYLYHKFEECFYANRKRIDIINRFECASIYALQYHYLKEALTKYKQEKIRFSSCAIFQNCWFDHPTRIYFKNQPEETMQISLKEYLTNSLRGVDVVREYNLGASKPVDIRVYWKGANRAALIELKWLGHSKDDAGALSTSYANGRGNDGLDQLKEYMDLDNQDTPTCITKGYLVIIDGRRRGAPNNLLQINSANGMYYRDKEIDFDADKKFFESMSTMEEPIRMFAEPICS